MAFRVRSTTWTTVAVLGLLTLLPIAYATAFNFNVDAPGCGELDGWTQFGLGFYVQVCATGTGTGTVSGDFGTDNPYGSPPSGIIAYGTFLTIDVDPGLNWGSYSMTIRMYYTDQQAAALGIDPQTLQIYVWEGDGPWTLLPSTMGSDEHGAYLQIVLLVSSTFAPMGRSGGGPVGGVVVMPMNAPAIPTPWLALIGLVGCIGTAVLIAKKRRE